METLIPTSKESKSYQSYISIVDRLQKFLAQENFQQGERLPPERTLAEQFGSSRSSVRKAIQVLTAKGLIESRQGDGTYLREHAQTVFAQAIIDALCSEDENFDDAIELRNILEPAIAELAAIRHTKEQLNELKVVVCDQQRHLLTGEEDGNLDARFHQCLAECTGNALIIRTMRYLNKLYATSRTEDMRDVKWRQFSIDDHLRIINALEKRSPEESRRAIQKHIDEIKAKHPRLQRRKMVSYIGGQK